MRIVHLLAPAAFGGLERVVRDLSCAQAESGHQVLVAAIGQEEGDVRPFLDTLGDTPVETRSILLPPRAYLAERKEVQRTCLSWKAEILHTHGYRPDVVDGPMGRKLGLATITTVHGFTGGGLRNRLYEWLQCRAFQRFDGVVAVSGPLRQTLLERGVPDQNLHVVRNARADPFFLSRDEARRVLGVAEGAFQVGWIGRLSREKGPDIFLEAINRLPSTEGVQVSIIGTGPLREELQQYSGDHGLGGTIRFLGSLDDASRLLRAFDLLVLSSRTEGTPMVLLEAMAAETPVVATTVGGIPDMVSGHEAYLVPPEHPTDMAEAILSARRNPSNSSSLARKARIRFEAEYDLEDWVKRYDEVYRAASAVK